MPKRAKEDKRQFFASVPETSPRLFLFRCLHKSRASKRCNLVDSDFPREKIANSWRVWHFTLCCTRHRRAGGGAGGGEGGGVGPSCRVGARVVPARGWEAGASAHAARPRGTRTTCPCWLWRGGGGGGLAAGRRTAADSARRGERATAAQNYLWARRRRACLRARDRWAVPRPRNQSGAPHICSRTEPCSCSCVREMSHTPGRCQILASLCQP